MPPCPRLVRATTSKLATLTWFGVFPVVSVTVDAVLPGPTLSEGVEATLEQSAEQAGISIEEAATAFVRANRSSSIIQRPVTVDEVAKMVVYVASTHASATTGAALRVDGGVVDTIA